MLILYFNLGTWLDCLFTLFMATFTGSNAQTKHKDNLPMGHVEIEIITVASIMRVRGLDVI